MCLLTISFQLLRASMHSADTAQAHIISDRPLRRFAANSLIFYTPFALFCNQDFDARATAPHRDEIKILFQTASMSIQGVTLCRRFAQIRIARSGESDQDADSRQSALFAYGRKLAKTFKKDLRNRSLSNLLERCSGTRSTRCARWHMMALSFCVHN